MPLPESLHVRLIFSNPPGNLLALELARFGQLRPLSAQASRQEQHQFLVERMHAAILDVLEVRFGPVPPDVAAAVQAILEDERLKELHKFAAGCGDLGWFRARLQS